MANGCWRFALALAFCASGSWAGEKAAAQQPSAAEPPATPQAPATAGPKTASVAPPPRLKIDIERYVAEAIARDPSLALPRFKEEVEVRDVYQEALEAHLRGVDVECGASESGPPTTLEMNPYRGATVPVHGDFIAPAKLIAKGLTKLLGSKKPRYFLYAVHRPAAPIGSRTAAAASRTEAPALPGPMPPAPGDAEYVLREAPISENARASLHGTRWELVASFRDRESALAALDRLRRGFATLQRTHEDGRLPPWVSTTCRPPRIK